MVQDFQTIYNKHTDLVFNLCLNYLQNNEDAEEVTQDVFVKVHRQLEAGKFKGKSTLKTWIYRITINQCLDFLKAKKRKKRFGINLSIFGKKLIPNHTPALSVFKHPGVLLEDKEALEKLFQHINSLAEKQKTALILKAIDGLPQKEIADIMQLSLKAVESLLSRAKANLRKKRRGNNY